MNRSGQALVEWAILLPLFGTLIVAVLYTGKIFAIRQELIIAVREGARLYSSGRMPSKDVRERLAMTLRSGHPGIRVDPNRDIVVGAYSGWYAKINELDEVRIKYQMPNLLLPGKFIHMEEVCVIKHTPAYGPIGSLVASVGVHYGRPVDPGQ